MIWLSCITSLTLSQCAEPKKAESKSRKAYDSIVEYFSVRQKKKWDSSYTRLFILTENGCVSCNKHFLNLIKDNVSDKRSAYVLGTNGAYLDISNLDTFKNVSIDQSILETDYAIFHHSKVIFLTQDGIDTIINLSAQDLQQQFDLIRNRNTK